MQNSNAISFCAKFCSSFLSSLRDWTAAAAVSRRSKSLWRPHAQTGSNLRVVTVTGSMRQDFLLERGAELHINRGDDESPCVMECHRNLRKRPAGTRRLGRRPFVSEMRA